MNPEQMKARMAEIQARLEVLAAEDMTDESTKEINDLSGEFDGIRAKVEAHERANKVITDAKASAGRQSAAAPAGAPSNPAIPAGPHKDGLYGFKNHGEFFSAIRDVKQGRFDKRLSNAAGTAQEKFGEDGGFLIPPEIAKGIEKKVQGDQSLLPKTRQLKTVSNSMIVPLNETAPWDGTGITARWEGETQSHSATKPKFGEASFRLRKLISYVKVTTEMLEDSATLGSYLGLEAPEVMMHKVNSAIIGGNGVGMPQGLLSSGYRYSVAKESGQTADTVVYKNIQKMQSRILPTSFNNAVWLSNPGVKPQLLSMEFAPGSSTPVPVYLPGNSVAGRPFETLSGLPIIYLMGGVKALGDEGDIILADLSQYWSLVKTNGVSQDVSYHCHFDTDEVAFKFTMRMDGMVPWKAPVTTEFGAFEMSGIVTLAERA